MKNTMENMSSPEELISKFKIWMSDREGSSDDKFHRNFVSEDSTEDSGINEDNFTEAIQKLGIEIGGSGTLVTAESAEEADKLAEEKLAKLNNPENQKSIIELAEQKKALMEQISDLEQKARDLI